MKTASKPSSVLAATDFSKASQIAVGIAQSFAEQYGVNLTVFHVFTYVARHRYVAPVAWMVNDLRSRAERRLRSMKTRLQKSRLAVQTMVVDVEGSAAIQILEQAKRMESPLIVLGTHSRDKVERFLIGSTAEEVLRSADCPVVTVGPNVTTKPVPLQLQRLLLATDLTERSLAPSELLPSLLNGDTTVTVLYVTSPDAPLVAADWMKPIRDRLEPMLGDLKLNRQICFSHLVASEAPKAIVDFAEEEHSDLIIIGMHRAKTFSTHIAPKAGFQIIMSAPCPVLSLCV